MGIRTPNRLLLLIFAHAVLVPHMAMAGRADDEIHGNWTRDRRPASIASETSKRLNLAYNSLYHRQDLAACMHLGHAAEALKQDRALKPDQAESIDALLREARHFCNEDKVSRKQATDLVRNAIRVIHDRDIVPASIGPAPDDSESRNPAQQPDSRRPVADQ